MILWRRSVKYRMAWLAVLVCLSAIWSGGCSEPKSAVIVCPEAPEPANADAAVRNVLAGLQRQELRALWEFLPPSYQADVQELLRDFAERLDEKSWGPFVATCQKARLVTSQIRRKIDEPGTASNAADRELAAQLREIERLLDALCDGELSDIGRMRGIDVSQFIGGTGSRLLAALSHGALGDSGLPSDGFAEFSEVQVGLSDSTQDSAMLTLQWPGQAATQHRFVRVEKQWIPLTLAEAWPIQFPIVRKQCLEWADDLRSNPETWHTRLREIDQLLDELAETKSSAESRKVWQSGASRLAVAWFGATIPDSPAAAEVPVPSAPASKPVRNKRPDTEVLLPDEPQK